MLGVDEIKKRYRDEVNGGRRLVINHAAGLQEAGIIKRD